VRVTEYTESTAFADVLLRGGGLSQRYSAASIRPSVEQS
jgi:hypothetical protein